MQGGTTKKKEPPKQALRDILGSYDPMTVSTPLDRNLAQIATAQPINLATMLNAPSQQVSIARDPLAQINLGKSNTVRDIKPGKNVDEKIANYLSKKGKGGTTKKAEPAPTKDEPFLSDSVKRGLRDAGIILSGGVASLGEGIRGGNQMGANENILRNLGVAKQGDEQAILEDPNSPESAQARSLFSQLYGNRVKMPEKMTAAQFSAQSPVFDKILQRRLAEMRASAPKVGGAKPNPNMKEITQVKTFRDNLNQNLTELENLITKKGTFELTGSTQNRKQQLINEIANQYNKMLDPNSVVRPEEAKQISETLGVDGLLTSNKTALENIKGFRDQINRTSGGKLSNLIDSQDDADALQYARENPNDPYSKQILAMFGGR